MDVSLVPKDKDVKRLLDRLMQHPFQMDSPRVTQKFSRYKAVRYVNSLSPNKKKRYIKIANGSVGLKDNVLIYPYKNGYRIKIKQF